MKSSFVCGTSVYTKTRFTVLGSGLQERGSAAFSVELFLFSLVWRSSEHDEENIFHLLTEDKFWRSSTRSWSKFIQTAPPFPYGHSNQPCRRDFAALAKRDEMAAELAHAPCQPQNAPCIRSKPQHHSLRVPQWCQKALTAFLSIKMNLTLVPAQRRTCYLKIPGTAMARAKPSDSSLPAISQLRCNTG